jgi:RNA polymerase sigma-70 factor (ECF subfamily)
MAIPNRVVERELPHQAGPAEGDGPDVRLAADGDAEEHSAEVTQDVFVRAWQKLHTFRGEAAFGSWLYRLAINVVYGRQRTLSTRRDRFVSNEIPLARASSKERTVELAMDFETAIECLPDGARQIFVLHDVEGYKHREIADMLEITQGTSKSQLHRARMILREHLDR